MALDFLKILRELRGTGEPEAPYTDGIYHDITIKATDDDDITPRLAPGMYKSMQIMYSYIDELVPIKDELIVLEAMADELHSLYVDKATLDSLYADKVTLDSLYADKVTLDSLYADKATLDSLFSDKATLDSLFADKVKLDSLYADKVALDSLYADKTTLDRIYTSIDNIDRVHTSIDAVDTVAVPANLADIVTIADDLNDPASEIEVVVTNIDNINTVGTDIADVNTVATNISDINIVEDNIADINTVSADITNVNAVGTSIADVNAIADNMSDVQYFADRYQGPKSVEPTLRNDGSALQSGDLYFDISPVDPINYSMKVFNGTDWVVGYSTDEGNVEVTTVERFVATAGQTVFTSSTGYIVGSITVSFNGRELDSTDYTADDGSTIVLALGAALNDIIRITIYGGANVYSKFQVDTLLDPVVISDTTGVTGADVVTNMISLTQAEYDAIGTPSASTFYVITG